MRPNLLLAATLTLVSSVVFGAPKVGETAPDFRATDSNGKTVALSDFKGKLVVLEWTNDGCPFVRKHYKGGNMQSLQKEATAQGVTWLTIISSAPGREGHVSGKRANELSAERGATPAHVLLDEKGDVGHLYDAKTTPHMFIVGKDGKLIYAGGIDSIPSADADDIKSATAYVKLAMAEALAGKPVTHSVTRPYGCSIKY